MRAVDFRQSWRECDKWVRLDALKCVNDGVLRFVFETRCWFSVLVTDAPLFIKLQTMATLKRASCWLTPKLTWMRLTGAHWCFEMCQWCCASLCCENSLLIFGSSDQRSALYHVASHASNRVEDCQTLRLLIDAKADVNATDWCAHSCFTFVNDVVMRCVFETRFWFSVVVTDAPLFIKPPFTVAHKRFSSLLTPKLTWMRLTGAHWCFEMCHWCCVLLCCENSLLIFGSSNQVMALHVAAAGDHVEACKLLIDAKADVNATDRCAFIFQMCQWCCSGLRFWNSLLIFCCSNQRTALHHVVDCHDDSQIFRLLIAAKHAVNATDGCAFMFHICWWCCVALCFWILPLILCSSDRRTALHHYVDFLDNCKLFRLFMGAKDAVNATDGCAFMFQIC